LTNLRYVGKIIPGAPILKELTLLGFFFEDPAILPALAVCACNAASPDLKWHFDCCFWTSKSLAIIQEIVTWEKAKSMGFRLNMTSFDHSFEILRAIMSDSSCAFHLNLNYYEHDHTFLHLLRPCDRALNQTLQALQKPSAHPLISVHFWITTRPFEQNHKVIESIPQWSCHVKKLRLQFTATAHVCRRRVHTKLLDALRKNLHLQSVELIFDEGKVNADENFCAMLRRYFERNQKLQAIDEADSIPMNVWPFVFHLASCGGVDMLYGLLRQNLGYMLESWHCPPTVKEKYAFSCRQGIRKKLVRKSFFSFFC